MKVEYIVVDWLIDQLSSQTTLWAALGKDAHPLVCKHNAFETEANGVLS